MECSQSVWVRKRKTLYNIREDPAVNPVTAIYSSLLLNEVRRDKQQQQQHQQQLIMNYNTNI